MLIRAGMWHHVESTMKIGGNTLFVVGGKEEKGRLPTILLVTATATTQDADRHRSITLNLHVKKESGFRNEQFLERNEANNRARSRKKQECYPQNTVHQAWNICRNETT